MKMMSAVSFLSRSSNTHLLSPCYFPAVMFRYHTLAIIVSAYADALLTAGTVLQNALPNGEHEVNNSGRSIAPGGVGGHQSHSRRY
jgi:hypothetical protein